MNSAPTLDFARHYLALPGTRLPAPLPRAQHAIVRQGVRKVSNIDQGPPDATAAKQRGHFQGNRL